MSLVGQAHLRHHDDRGTINGDVSDTISGRAESAPIYKRSTPHIPDPANEQIMNIVYNEFPKCNVLRQDQRCGVLTV